LGEEDKNKIVFIPFLEVLHIGPVDENAFDGFVLLADRGSWHETSSDRAGLNELSKIAAGWVTDAERKKLERHARGEYSHAELVEASYKAES